MKTTVNEETEEIRSGARNRIAAKRRAASLRAEAAETEKAVEASLKRRTYRMNRLVPQKEEEAVPEEVIAAEEIPAETPKEVIEISAYKESGSRELKTLDELKENFKAFYEQEGMILQKDILSALEHYDMTDEDMENLYVWFDDEQIRISEDEDVTEMDDDDVDLLDDSDGDGLDDDAERDVVEDINAIINSTDLGHSGSIQLNDPVKMYL
ncbi:MAG: hypothetical protein IKF51_04650, partial [Solobacterium sp.]|nr:hypothetical protein [Solobacterium sp.]